jgi:hypothetical protein
MTIKDLFIKSDRASNVHMFDSSSVERMFVQCQGFHINIGSVEKSNLTSSATSDMIPN